MTLIPILTTLEEIETLATELAAEREIAVDLEADSLHSYREKVCLLQFTWGERTALVDPLPLPHLEPLKPVLADPAVTKVFHAADYDIRSLRRDFDIQIRGLFDTMIASQFCGEEKWGLADLLLKYFDIALDKQYQRADWSERPLSEGMIRYAAEDTRHLFRLQRLLAERLDELGRRDWVAEEFALLEQVRMAENEGPLFLRFKGAGRLDRRQLATLEALLQWRDGEARRRDKPPFKVVGNTQLLNIALAAPGTSRALLAVEAMPPRVAHRYGAPLLAAVEGAHALPEGELPRYPKGPRQERDPQMESRFKRLKSWRQQKAAQLQLDPGVLINNATLEAVARRQPATTAELAELPLKGWQRRALGDELIRALD